MAAASRRGDLSAGHACFPPTNCTSGVASKTFINGIPAQIIGSSYTSHRCGKSIHFTRLTSTGSSTVFIEGVPAIRIGDSISCGDSVGQGSPNVQFGG
jgi:uncharacterized Zn-binding protein involved in type VI secretion